MGGDGEGVRPGEAVGVGVGLLPLCDFCEVDDSAELCDLRIFSGCPLSASNSCNLGINLWSIRLSSAGALKNDPAERLRQMERSNGPSPPEGVSAGGGVLMMSMDFCGQSEYGLAKFKAK